MSSCLGGSNSSSDLDVVIYIQLMRYALRSVYLIGAKILTIHRLPTTSCFLSACYEGIISMPTIYLYCTPEVMDFSSTSSLTAILVRLPKNYLGSQPVVDLSCTYSMDYSIFAMAGSPLAMAEQPLIIRSPIWKHSHALIKL